MHLSDFEPYSDGCEMLGSDIMIPCLIYVYIKAMVPEIVALLMIISNFTLEKHQTEFSFIENTMKAIDEFIRNELHKLDRKTERFTYSSLRLSTDHGQLLSSQILSF